MSRFRSPDPRLTKAYEAKKHLPVLREAKPASAVCDSCWGRNECLWRVVMENEGPNTCCVYDFFQANDETVVQSLVHYTCETACVARQSWAYDHAPHDASYCQNHCPVSRFLLGQGPSDYEPVGDPGTQVQP